MRKLLVAICRQLSPIVAIAAFVHPAAAQQARPFHLVAAATNNATLISTGSHSLFGAQLGGVGAAPAYLKIYDKATAPTCGTDVPVKTLIIPSAATAALGGGSNVNTAEGVLISLGLGICVTAGIADNDNTAVAAATYTINIDYK